MVGKHSRKCLRLNVLWRSASLVGLLLLLGIQAALGGNSIESGKGGTTRSAPSGIEVQPEAVAFVNVPVGDIYSQTVRIANVGEETLQIKQIGASSADFQISGILLPVVVAPRTTQGFTISYKPRVEGRIEVQISILTSASNSPAVLTVSATSVAGHNELTASETGIDFEEVAIGSSGKKELSLTNSGNRDLRISGASISGSDFAIAGGAALHLSPGQSVGVQVSFSPKVAGRQTGNLVVVSAEGETLLRLPVNAIGAPSSSSAVKLNWEENPASVTGYVVYRSAEPAGPYTRISSLPTPSTEYVDSGLAAGRTYYYVVSSLDANQAESEYSAPISATVPEA